MSHTTVQRAAADLATRLHDAALRYQDVLAVSAQRRLGPTDLDQLEPNGPLPWLPLIPPELAADPEWGSYLSNRAQLVTDLAARIDAPTTAAWGRGFDPELSHQGTTGLPETVTSDPSARVLQGRIQALANGGVDVHELITRALAEPRPLPAENPADALWWRIVAADAASPRPATDPRSVQRSTPPPASRQPMPPYRRPVARGRGIGR